MTDPEDGVSSYTEAFLQADAIGGNITYDGQGGFVVEK